ncbi:hypothetical protein [Brasilonema sennae]|uniref:hypothetical protein n=1 Tax=Brasilonema sennae TaxID=1397703 RepID=UPI001C12F29E|nr:hypothetical protein [Brasilonema sennae]
MGTATPYGYRVCLRHAKGERSRLGRETLQRALSHQIPRSGNPFGCAQSARLTANALVGTATPYGESSAAGGSPSAGDWRTRRAIGNARRLTPHSTLPEGVPPTTGGTLRSRHNGQSSSLGLLPPTDFGGTPTPDPYGGKPSYRTGSLRVHQSPTAGNPLRSCHNAGNPRKAQLLAALDSPQGAALRTEVAHEGNPPAALDSPDACGGRPSRSRLSSPPAVLAPQRSAS